MENCKGCPIKEDCSYTEYSNKCPCVTCLVKVTCGNMCNDHIFFQVKSYAIKADTYNQSIYKR